MRKREDDDMARHLSGKEVADALNQRLQVRVSALKARGVVPRLAVIRCGKDPSDLSYERGAIRRAGLIGAEVDVHEMPEDVSKQALTDQILALNEDASVHGVLLFRPLPGHLKAYRGEIYNALDPAKDVDGMTDLSCAGVYEGRSDMGFPPCTPCACMEILDHYGIDCAGKRAVVIGRSLVVGRPMAMMLMGRHATVTVCHTRTADVPGEARRADILVSSAGVPGFITRDFVRPGQTVIDVSVNWDPEKPDGRGGKGAIAGDAAYDEIESVVEAITPVPGGVGAVTTSVLFAHVLEAAERLTASPI